jgi:hypothetical protein
MRMEHKREMERLPGRRMIDGDSEARRAMLPMNAASDALDSKEMAILLRFTEASELSKGNAAVSVIGGRPRGRYALFAERVPFDLYREAEVGAYRWILASAFGAKARGLTEALARLNGERIESFDALELGKMLANTVSADVAFGALIGSTKTCCIMLEDAYRDYAEYYRVRQAAAASGRALTDEESVRRQRRGDMTRRVIQGYRTDLDGSAA